MSANPKGVKRPGRGMRVWTLPRARAAVPYVASVLRSVREHTLEAQRQRLLADRLAAQPGRPDRAALIAHQDAIRAEQEARARCDEALKELRAVDVVCADPVRGQAWFPFLHNKRPAWYLFDLFEATPLRYWRYHHDDANTRRPVAEPDD